MIPIPPVLTDHPQTEALVHDLSAAIGEKNVRFDAMTRLLYSTDASSYQIIPMGATFPRHSDDVVAIHETAARYGVPVLPRGGGSSLAGQTVGTAVVMDFTRHMRRVLSVNADEHYVQVEPGLPLGLLNDQLAALGLMFGPDPASAERAAVGGVIGNNATGAHSIVYGMTADHVRRVQVVLADGEKVWLDAHTESLRAIREKVAAIVNANASEIATRYPKTWRTCAGYALDRINPANVDLNVLIPGSEGTLATIVNAELNLVPRITAQHTHLALLHFDRLRDSLEATPRILELKPTAIELIDRFLMNKTRSNPTYSKDLTFVQGDPAVVLIVEFTGESQSHLRAQVDALRNFMAQLGYRGAITVAETPTQQAQVWNIRKNGLGLLLSDRAEAKPLAFIEDAAVPVEHLADYIQDVEEIIQREGTTYAIYAHASAGCLHIRPLINLKSLRGQAQFQTISEAVALTTLKYQGTLSGEHGKGITHGRNQRLQFGDQLAEAFMEVKHAFDPLNRMNPGKMLDAPAFNDTSVMRYSPAYEVIPLKTRYDWSADNGLSGAVDMCNGAGVCRKEGRGTMCPSYQATRDEAHSTRGRANALRAAISGKLPDDVGSDALYDVFDLCLSCKSCKSECPSSVDVAMMKAEFLALYYDRHGIPLRAWIFANIHRVNQLAGIVPSLSNAVLSSAWGKGLMSLVGLPIDRPLPLYSVQRFTAAVAANRNAHPSQSDSVATLIVDTYTEYNHPQVGLAALKIADALGARLRIRTLPAGSTGRPAISKGLLDDAKRMAEHNLRELNPADGPFLYLEPSELSAVIDDYLTLVSPALQAKARDIANVSMSAEAWLAAQLANTPDIRWDKTSRDILLHGHCHQKALWGTQDTLALLRSIPNATVQEMNTGCCGVAGSFGYEHYELSMKVAQDRLLPAIETAPSGTIITAPGTSCRAQIHDNGHPVLHPVEVVAAAIRSTL